MDLETLYSILNLAVLPAWALLALAPKWERGVELIASWVVPGIMGLSYAGLFAWNIATDALPEGGFDSLAGVTALLGSPEGALVGWVHYLCFDLFVGAWEVRDARRLGLPHAAVVPCLFFTLMAGPVGLVLYLALRAGLKGEVGVRQ